MDTTLAEWVEANKTVLFVILFSDWRSVFGWPGKKSKQTTKSSPSDMQPLSSAPVLNVYDDYDGYGIVAEKQQY